MATLTPTLSLVSTDATNDELNLTVTDDLTVVAPYTGVAKTSVSTTGANNIIQPATDGQTYYVYVKHTGVDACWRTLFRSTVTGFIRNYSSRIRLLYKRIK